MHIQHSVHIDQPVKVVSEALLDEPATWFPKTVGLHVSGVPIRKKVAIEFGSPVKTMSWAVLPLTWRATFAEKLFPVMNGKVEVAPVTKDETRITVSGMYEPPLGRLGEQLDEAVMHRVAEGTVKELAQQIAARLEKAAKP